VRLADSLGLSSHTHFRKGVLWDALPQELSMMDVGVVANRASLATHLMLPSKLIDYASLGIPAVVPKLRAIEYYFTSDMVAYFEPEDIEGMARAVLSLYWSKARRQQQAANARRFQETYKWSTNHELRDLYAGLFSDAVFDKEIEKSEATHVLEGVTSEWKGESCPPQLKGL
jgi:glycosyltransferase involved in cell wall biosynthesis